MSIKHKKYAKRSRKPSRNQLCGMAVATLIVVSLLAAYSFRNQPNQANDEFKAAIIDQLSSLQEFTNETFVRTTTDILTTAGYQVTYYKGSDINVPFYQTLATDGYKILIFRVHSALRLSNATTSTLTVPLDFFTSEPYSDVAYGPWQLANLLDIVMYNVTSKNQYFGIPPSFVVDAMEGSFQNATIILEGCNGLDGQGRSETMLQALVYRGAKVIIGWNASVSMNHTDTAVENLLDHLLLENQTVKEAVNATNNEVGQDPAYNNQLLYYPSTGLGCGTNDVGNYTIPHGSSNSATKEMNGNYASSSANEGVIATPLLLSVKELRVFRKLRKKTSASHSVLKQ